MKHFKLLRSCVKGKMPNPDTMDYGEIAINFNAEEPFISFKNTDDEMVKIGNSSINEDEFIKWTDELPASKIIESLGFTPAPSDALEQFQVKGDYALKSDIPDLTLYIKNTQLPIYLRNYVLKNELPNLEEYVKFSDEIPSQKILDALGYTPADADILQSYATKQEIIQDYPTRDEINAIIGQINTQLTAI